MRSPLKIFINYSEEISNLRLKSILIKQTKLASVTRKNEILYHLVWCTKNIKSLLCYSFQRCTFALVQSLSHVWLFKTPCTAAYQAFLSFSISQNPLKLVCTELVMPSNHLILCRPLLLLPSIFPSNRVFSNESAVFMGRVLDLQLLHKPFQWCIPWI